MTTLNQQYEEKVRPCIDLIDSLRSLGVEKDLALPAIAVIGDQSSGKSSVLEALSGVALPRGSGIVTRCPLELKMKRKREGEEWYGKISYKGHEEVINDPADVEKMIREAQKTLAGVGVGISDDLISLEIASPDVPDLTLIDLPGITRVAVKGQPENIGDQIKRLIHTFITKQETISLVVVPSNVDIETTEALKMAQEVDPSGDRTLGILTKPDLVDKGTEEMVVDVVRNEVIHLKKGYMIVRCRGQKEITDQVSLTEAIRREKSYFHNHVHFKTLYDKGHATVPKLAEKLTLELVHHIQRSLPQLEKQIEMKITESQEKLDKCGSGPPLDAADRLGFLIDKLAAFTQEAIRLCTGEEIQFGGRLNIFAILREQFADWKSTIVNSGIIFNQKIEREVNQYEKRYRGRELPGFINYKTFEDMVKEQIKKLEVPAVLKLKKVTDLVMKELFELAQCSLVGFPNLIKIAQVQINAITKEKATAAESMLKTQFKMEMIVYTQDNRYSKKLVKRKRDEDKSTPHFNNDSGATLRSMIQHLKSYYKIAGQRLADQIPLIIRYQVMQESAVQLQREMLQMFQNNGNTELLLHEDGGTKTDRIHNQKRIKRLSAARCLLTDFSLNNFNQGLRFCPNKESNTTTHPVPSKSKKQKC
ncbi:interferon-induced GTP-binding protein Mx-like [Spinachia spinachia]